MDCLKLWRDDLALPAAAPATSNGRIIVAKAIDDSLTKSVTTSTGLYQLTLGLSSLPPKIGSTKAFCPTYSAGSSYGMRLAEATILVCMESLRDQIAAGSF